jgi:hypothetical protein
MSTIPLVNGTRHGWANIEVTLFGRTLTGITNIKYEQEQEKENYYGAGNQPQHRGRGNKKATASIKLYKYEVDAILDTIPGKDLTDIAPFNIAVIFKPEGSDRLRKDIIHDAEFTKSGYDMKQGDKMLEVELPLIISYVEFNRL